LKTSSPLFHHLAFEGGAAGESEKSDFGRAGAGAGHAHAYRNPDADPNGDGDTDGCADRPATAYAERDCDRSGDVDAYAERNADRNWHVGRHGKRDSNGEHYADGDGDEYGYADSDGDCNADTDGKRDSNCNTVTLDGIVSAFAGNVRSGIAAGIAL
jgi:hypothetical protein